MPIAYGILERGFIKNWKFLSMICLTFLSFCFCLFFLFVCFQVSAVTDQVGAQDLGGNTGDFDDDDGGGLVQTLLLFI